MKKIAIVTAISLASISGAHAAPQVYGKVFLGLDYINTDYEDPNKDDDSSVKVQSHSSRIGFKGDEELMAGTDLIYQLEYGVNTDDNSGNFSSRNTYLGLANSQYGTVLVGRHDTPFKLSKGNVEQFGDYKETDIGKLMMGEVRANNVIAYKSPTIVGMPITFMAAAAQSEVNTNDESYYIITPEVPATYKLDKDGKTVVVDKPYKAAVVSKEKQIKNSGFSTSLAYEQNGVYAAVGYDNNVELADSAWRLTGSVDMGKMNMVNGLMLGAMYQSTNVFDKSDDENAWLISGKYKVGTTPWAVKAQYVNTDNFKGVKDDQVTEIALGTEYTFNKATKAHMYVAQINKDAATVNKDEDKMVVGGGIEYKF